VDGKANLPTLEETDWSLDNPDEATRYKNMSADEREVRKMSVFLLMFSLGFFLKPSLIFEVFFTNIYYF